ncbi:ATP-binding protein [Balneatrix alpica]|uniref:ATP-binding protein n=1 Tax=Balneatrix alpica TaxID=75684 RepID=A0ABV5ZCL2_9GAMM|nr:ATP-binding protein [Balneatrix alpica]
MHSNSHSIDWQHTLAAIWRPQRQALRPVRRLDPIRLEQLLGIERQKQAMLDNTARFLRGQESNHALLWGARGTGKSSLLKALLNHFAAEGLRMIQVDKDDLLWLPEIVDQLEDATPYRFIIFCDDLSFEAGDASYKPLKTLLDGSLELPPEHIRIYASSNRRHLVPEQQSDNLGTQVVDTELHYGDAVEDKLALSDRFGLWLSFYPPSWDAYLAIVDQLFHDYQGDRAELHAAAKRFAMGRASHSGRTARQFFQSYRTHN